MQLKVHIPYLRLGEIDLRSTIYGLKTNLFMVAWWDWVTHANRTTNCYLLVANKNGIIAIFIMAILLYNLWQLIVLNFFTLILSSLIKTFKQQCIDLNSNCKNLRCKNLRTSHDAAGVKITAKTVKQTNNLLF